MRSQVITLTYIICVSFLLFTIFSFYLLTKQLIDNKKESLSRIYKGFVEMYTKEKVLENSVFFSQENIVKVECFYPLKGGLPFNKNILLYDNGTLILYSTSP